MKIRNGFVSNSSSSSFVIIAKQITKAELLAAENPFISNFWSSWGSEGSMFMEIPEDYKSLIMENKLDSNTALWDVKYISEDELKFNRQTTIPKDYIIFTSCVGYHQPEDEDDFREVFLQHDEG